MSPCAPHSAQTPSAASRSTLIAGATRVPPPFALVSLTPTSTIAWCWLGYSVSRNACTGAAGHLGRTTSSSITPGKSGTGPCKAGGPTLRRFPSYSFVPHTRLTLYAETILGGGMRWQGLSSHRRKCCPGRKPLRFDSPGLARAPSMLDEVKRVGGEDLSDGRHHFSGRGGVISFKYSQG